MHSGSIMPFGRFQAQLPDRIKAVHTRRARLTRAMKFRFKMSRMLPSCKRAQVRLVLSLLGTLITAAQPAPVPAEGCPARPPCHGCGCKGGPGYRAPDGRCVGFLELERKCGAPPTLRCTFENAPGTGANAECATRSRTHPQRPGLVDPEGERPPD